MGGDLSDVGVDCDAEVNHCGTYFVVVVAVVAVITDTAASVYSVVVVVDVAAAVVDSILSHSWVA